MDNYEKYFVRELVGNYQDGLVGRREAFLKLAAVTGSAAIATSLLAGVQPAQAQSAPADAPAGTRVPEDDPTVTGQEVTFPGPAGELMGYLAMPATAGVYPGVVIVHENAGTSPHFKDVARRAAKNGFVAIAVDLLSRVGGTDTIAPEERSAYFSTGREFAIPVPALVEDLAAYVGYLESHPSVKQGGYGAFGFCFGGGMVWQLALADPRVIAAVPFYGPVPALDDVPNLGATMLALYGVQDRFVNPGIPALTDALIQAGKPFQIIVYPNAGHAFFNDTRSSYVPEVAADAWIRTVDFLQRNL